ncbi:SH3 domain-containing protein [Moraxella sp. ZJ142]|uniref:SH3 domain-containing protein n=1 Tax=Moraxella marmotae TaxID=3344520 RepID=UPI0035D3F2A2
MKKMLILSGAIVGATMLTACDDIVKGVAREILKDEAPAQQAPAAQPQVQNLQPVIVDGQAQQPVQQQYDQNGHPVAQQPVQQVPVQQAPVQQAPVQAAPPPTVVVYKERQPPKQEVVFIESSGDNYILTQKDGFVYMRSEPYAKAHKIAKLKDYTPVAILDCGGVTYRHDVTEGNRGAWCLVEANGKRGYVFNSYIHSR